MKSNDRVEAHPVFRSGNRDEVVQNVGEEAGELFLPIRGGGKQLQLNLRHLFFHEVIDRTAVPAASDFVSFREQASC